MGATARRAPPSYSPASLVRVAAAGPQKLRARALQTWRVATAAATFFPFSGPCRSMPWRPPPPSPTHRTAARRHVSARPRGSRDGPACPLRPLRLAPAHSSPSLSWATKRPLLDPLGAARSLFESLPHWFSAYRSMLATRASPAQLQAHHAANQRRAGEAMRKRRPVIVVDNTCMCAAPTGSGSPITAKLP